MKSLPPILALLLCLAFQASAIDPFLTVATKDYATWLETTAKIADLFEPERDNLAKLEKDLKRAIGSSTLAGVDPSRPWQLAVWQRGMKKPLSVTYVPLSDADAFRKDRDADSLEKRGYTLLESGNHAVIVMEDASEYPLPEAYRKEVLSHAARIPLAVKSYVTADLQVSKDLREQALQGLALARMMTANMGAQQGEDGSQGLPEGFNANALSDLMGVYITFLEVFLNGVEDVSFNVDFDDGALQIREEVKAVAETELADWFSKSKGSVQKLAGGMDWGSSMTLVYHMGNIPKVKDLFFKATRASYELQGMQFTETTMKQTKDMLDLFFPMVAGMSLEMLPEGGMKFDAVYHLPGKSAEEAHKNIQKLTEEMIPQITGDEMIYKSMEYLPESRRIKDIVVGEMDMVINLDHPFYKAPGQRENMERMIPGGRISLELARDRDLFHVTNKGRMEEILSREGKEAPLTIGPSTTMAGHFNVVEMIKAGVATNPMIPQSFKEILNAIDSKGADVGVVADLDESLVVNAEIPLGVIGRIVRQSKDKMKR